MGQSNVAVCVRKPSGKQAKLTLPLKPLKTTLPETNMAPENGWLEYQKTFGMAYFQVLC